MTKVACIIAPKEHGQRTKVDVSLRQKNTCIREVRDVFNLKKKVSHDQ